MTPTPETTSTPETDLTPDHRTTPDTETPIPAEDHQGTTNVKITEPITPWHHDPVEINCSVADALSALILFAAAEVAARAGGARC